jgi:hypothetical protein
MRALSFQRRTTIWSLNSVMASSMSSLVVSSPAEFLAYKIREVKQITHNTKSFNIALPTQDHVLVIADYS